MLSLPFPAILYASTAEDENQGKPGKEDGMVPVLSPAGTTLAATSEARARQLIKAGRAVKTTADGQMAVRLVDIKNDERRKRMFIKVFRFVGAKDKVSGSFDYTAPDEIEQTVNSWIEENHVTVHSVDVKTVQALHSNGAYCETDIVYTVTYSK